MKKVLSTLLISFLMSGFFSYAMAAFSDNTKYCEDYRKKHGDCSKPGPRHAQAKCCKESSASAPVAVDPSVRGVGQVPTSQEKHCLTCSTGRTQPPKEEQRKDETAKEVEKI